MPFGFTREKAEIKYSEGKNRSALYPSSNRLLSFSSAFFSILEI